MSRVIAIAGRPKSGKSTLAKAIVIRTLYPDAPEHIPAEEVELLFRALRGSGYFSRLMVYDVNREWGAGPLPKSDDFLKQAVLARDRLMVFEEATIFFDPTRGRSEELREMLVRRRHTGVGLILLFHAIADVPLYVLRMVDTLIAFKTQDTLDDLRRIRHLRPLVELLANVNASPDPHAFAEYDFLEGNGTFTERL